MRYRSAAFARLSAHALAGDGSTHFPARGVDADALLGTAAVLYLLRFAGDIITAEQTFVTGVVPPVRVVATVVLVAFVEIVRIDVVRPTLPSARATKSFIIKSCDGVLRGARRTYTRIYAGRWASKLEQWRGPASLLPDQISTMRNSRKQQACKTRALGQSTKQH